MFEMREWMNWFIWMGPSRASHFGQTDSLESVGLYSTIPTAAFQFRECFLRLRHSGTTKTVTVSSDQMSQYSETDIFRKHNFYFCFLFSFFPRLDLMVSLNSLHHIRSPKPMLIFPSNVACLKWLVLIYLIFGFQSTV